MNNAEQDLKALLGLWRLRSQRASKAHYIEATRFKNIDFVLTILNVVTSIILVTVSSAYWLVNASIYALNVIIGLAAILNVITSILQYVLDYRGRAVAHKSSGAEYAMMSRGIEVLMLESKMNDHEIKKIEGEIDGLGDVSPVITRRIWNSEAVSDFTARIAELENKLF
jgi:hypothetical protein